MSPLDHDRLLDEGSVTLRAAAPSAAPEVPSPRRTRTTTEEKAPAKRSRTAAGKTAAAAARTPRAKAATATAVTAAKAATKAASTATAAKRTAAKATPAKAAPAKAAPAKAAPTKVTPAKATPAKATATKTTPAKATPAKAGRPRPAKPVPAARPAANAVRTGAAAPDQAVPPAVVVAPPGQVELTAPRRHVARARFLRRLRLQSVRRRRPAILLVGAMVAAIGAGLFAGSESMAAEGSAGSAGHSVSVAKALGLSSKQAPAPGDPSATQQLGLLAASRAQREAAQTAAAQAQSAADQAAIEAARPKAVLPVPGGILTSGFGFRWGALHAGIDLAAPLGTPEYAVMDGVVLKAGPASGFGQAVYIQHANGDVTVYGHMEKILVTAGQVVHAGDTIALLGAEGEATGPHLHLEVHVGGLDGQKIDPIPWLRDRGVQI
jgi:hypothetical protein